MTELMQPRSVYMCSLEFTNNYNEKSDIVSDFLGVSHMHFHIIICNYMRNALKILINHYSLKLCNNNYFYYTCLLGENM